MTAHGQRPQVFRIDSRTSQATGFRTLGESGIVTCLHAVLDSPLRARSGNTVYRNLEIVYADVERDIAIISSDELSKPANKEEGYSLAPAGERLKVGNRVVIYGYPLDLFKEDVGGFLYLRPDPARQLNILLDDDTLGQLKGRGSPNTDITVISLDGNILEGHSGSPILDENGQVLGIANGSLGRGEFGLAWAVPIDQVKWKPYSAVQGQVQNLRKLGKVQPLKASTRSLTELSLFEELADEAGGLLADRQLNEAAVKQLRAKLEEARVNANDRLKEPIVRSYVAVASARVALVERKYDEAERLITDPLVTLDAGKSKALAERVRHTTAQILGNQANSLSKEPENRTRAIQLERKAIEILDSGPEADTRGRLMAAASHFSLAVMLVQEDRENLKQGLDEVEEGLRVIHKVADSPRQYPRRLTEELTITALHARSELSRRAGDNKKLKASADAAIILLDTMLKKYQLTPQERRSFLETKKELIILRAVAHATLNDREAILQDAMDLKAVDDALEKIGME